MPGERLEEPAETLE